MYQIYKPDGREDASQTTVYNTSIKRNTYILTHDTLDGKHIGYVDQFTPFTYLRESYSFKSEHAYTVK